MLQTTYARLDWKNFLNNFRAQIIIMSYKKVREQLKAEIFFNVRRTCLSSAEYKIP